MDIKITNSGDLAAILAYCKARYQPCAVIRTEPDSEWGGLGCELLEIEGKSARIKIANGDERWHPISEIHARGVI